MSAAEAALFNLVLSAGASNQRWQPAISKSRWWKRTRVAAVMLFVVGVVLFMFGPQYEIHKIPIERRSRMGDFDWIGVEWIAAGMLCMTVSLLFWMVRFFLGKSREAAEDPDR